MLIPNPRLHIRLHYTSPPCAQSFCSSFSFFLFSLSSSYLSLRHRYRHHHRFHNLQKSNDYPFHVIIDIIMTGNYFEKGFLFCEGFSF